MLRESRLGDLTIDGVSSDIGVLFFVICKELQAQVLLFGIGKENHAFVEHRIQINVFVPILE